MGGGRARGGGEGVEEEREDAEKLGEIELWEQEVEEEW